MNQVILIGRLTKDIELMYIPTTGSAVANFSIAVDRNYKGKDKEKITDFFNIKTFGKIAEHISNYLSKGMKIAVKGQIQNRSYENDKGEKRYITEILAESIEFLEFKKDKGDNVIEEGYKAISDDNVPF